MTTTAMSLTPSLPSSFQLASDEVHSWCASPKADGLRAHRPGANPRPARRPRPGTLAVLGPPVADRDLPVPAWLPHPAALGTSGSQLPPRPSGPDQRFIGAPILRSLIDQVKASDLIGT